jgi:hypothetical protein
VIEAQLAHGKSGPLGAAYDRAEFMDKRKDMMQRWADYLDHLAAGAQVLALKAASSSKRLAVHPQQRSLRISG